MIPHTGKAVSALWVGAALCAALGGCETLPEEQFASPAARQAVPTLEGSYHQVQRGETLWRIARSYGLDVRTLAIANRLPPSKELSVGQKLFIPLPAETKQFLWPVRGSARTSISQGVDISAPSGSLVRASRSGRVAVAAHRLSGWGKTVVLDHFDGYLTIYAGLDRILVAPAAALRQGVPIGTVGSKAMHFEIRYGNVPKNTPALLPEE